MSPEKTKPKQTKKKRTAKKTTRFFSAKKLKAFIAKDFKTTTKDLKALAKGTGKLLRGPGKFLLWLLWDFSGVRYICSKIRPPLESEKPERKPATFFLWVLGIYTALYGIASQRYENRVDIIENRSNAIFTQLATPIYKKALARIPRVQEMPCPKKPYILKPVTVFSSLVGRDGRYYVMVELLKETVENWREKLQGVKLGYVQLQNADLQEANLQDAYLRGADLRGARLRSADLREAWLMQADLREAWLMQADLRKANLVATDMRGANLHGANIRNTWLLATDLRGAYLWSANLRKVDFLNADLRGAWLRDADLRGARNLTTEQLLQAFTLHGIKGLDTKMEKDLRMKKPGLFENPSIKHYKRFNEATYRILKEPKKKSKKKRK